MAGHSHAANIAVKKGKADRLRAKVFAKLSKDIMVAARGGPDPNFNFALRHAVEMARAQSMPNDKIDHAVKRGAGQLEGQKISEIVYEAYAPGGVALLIECVTDNPNRTRPEVGTILEKAGGKMAAPNSVLYMFKRRGVLTVKCADITEERLYEIVLAAGADDVQENGETFRVLTAVESFETVRKALAEAKVVPAAAELCYLPDNRVEAERTAVRKVIGLLADLDEHEDVAKVFSNLAETAEVAAARAEEEAAQR